MQLFFNPNIGENDSEIDFSKDESRHIIKVLRKSIGDKLFITNGKGYLFTSELISQDYKNCKAKIIDKEFQENLSYELHMAVGPTKMNDRFEWFLEKVTEIGVTSITPIFCENSERTVIKPQRFVKIIQSAVKQSLRYHMPVLNEAISFQDFIAQNNGDQLFIAHCEDGNKRSLKSQIKPNGQYIILIGPEGDFSSGEIKQALQKKYIPVSLGENRLRTETAAIVACHTFALANQN